MAKKDRTFASKMTKGGQEASGKKCPVCGEIYNVVKVVATEKSQMGTHKFKENMVGVCKCNEKEVYA